MTNPEYFFDERNPADYSMFAIRYLILPSGWAPPVAAHLLLRAGPYALWRTESSGYLNVGAVVGTLDGDRTDLGARSYPLLRSPLGSEHAYLRVNAAGPGRGRPTLPTVHQVSTGSVSTETDHLVQGKVSATVSMQKPGVAVLSASFDPGWTVTVDGHVQRTEMIAPAVVGVRVPAGVHRIVFQYDGFSDYPLLFAISALALTLLFLADRVLVRRRRNALKIRSAAVLASPTNADRRS
jgi:Bacterial membrane protein YfhO